jgi:MEDS: MEthanogen/methylotroph, DcmR Sensory domain
MALTAPQLLESSEPRRHLVQLYGDSDRGLTTNVARFLAAGFSRGEPALVVATPEHIAGVLGELARSGQEPSAAIAESRLTVLDARATLETILVDGAPEWSRFAQVVGERVDGLCGRSPAGVRAYGEMVGLLWERGLPEGAVRLEGFWNRMLSTRNLSLFCGYPIDIFGREFELARVDDILCAHSHLLPSGPEVEPALEQAMQDVLGPRLEGLRALIKTNYRPAWASLPPAEAVILWLRNNLSTTADAILARAAHYYRRPHLQRR